MKITAVTKFKHGTIHGLLRKLNWTQKELAKRAKVCQSKLGRVINLKQRPTQRMALAVQSAFGEVGEFLDILAEWPECFQGLANNRLEQTCEVPTERLLDHPEALLIADESSGDNTEIADFSERICQAIAILTPREQTVINARLSGSTFDEIAANRKRSNQKTATVREYRDPCW